MQKKMTVWDAARTRKKLDELVEPGAIGFYRSVEVTEVFGVQDKSATNFLTLAFAEPIEAPAEVDWKSTLLNQKRLRLRGTDWSVGIAQYRLSLECFLEKISEFDSTGRWKPTAYDLQTGTLAAVPPQFVPADGSKNHPWNGVLKDNFFEAEAPLRLRDIWPVRVRLQIAKNTRDLALFNLAIDSKLRACDLTKPRVRDIAHGADVSSRAIVMQQKTHRPVQFEITDHTRTKLEAWIHQARLRSENFLFPSRLHGSGHLTTRQYARIVKLG